MKLHWTKSRFVSILILTGWEIGEGFTEKLRKEVKQNKSIPRSFLEPQLFWSLLYKGTVDMRLILLCSLYEIYSWPQKSREMLYSKHELDKLCTLVKIQDSESHTLVDVHMCWGHLRVCICTPSPSQPPSPPPCMSKLWNSGWSKQNAFDPIHLSPPKPTCIGIPWIFNQLTLRIWICQHAHYKFTVKSTYFTMYTRYNQGSLCKIKAMKWRTQIDIGNKRISSAVWCTINVKISSLKFSLQPPLVYSLVKRGFIIQTSVRLPGY